MSLLDIVIALLVFEAVLIISAIAYIVHENKERSSAYRNRQQTTEG